MFKKILYPTDFSDVSKKALDYIKQLKSIGAEEVLVVHIIDERGFHAIEAYSSGNASQLEKEIIEGVAEELKAIVK